MTLKPGPIMAPLVVVRRLPMYYRHLVLLKEKGVERISSRELSRMMGITSSQLRQDLSYFGEFGQQGYGYRVGDLYQAICEILGLEKEYRAVLVGVGNLGRALLNYDNFRKRGLSPVGIFDCDPGLIGEKVGGLVVKSVDELPSFLGTNDIEVGIITTPAASAQEVAQVLAGGGVKGIWNFAPCAICVPDVVVENAHLGDGLLRLFFLMKHEGGN